MTRAPASPTRHGEARLERVREVRAMEASMRADGASAASDSIGVDGAVQSKCRIATFVGVIR